MRTINTRADLRDLHHDLGTRPDWHEPDEQEVNARVVGDHLDNAMGATIERNCGEMNVVITREGEDVAVVNLANLLAWASEPQATPGVLRDDAEATVAAVLIDLTHTMTPDGVRLVGGGITADVHRDEVVTPMTETNNAWAMASRRLARSIIERITR